MGHAPAACEYEWSNTDIKAQLSQVMTPTCIIVTIQPFSVSKLSLAISGSTWNVSHLRRTALLMFFSFDSSSLIPRCLQTGQGRRLTRPQAASIFQSMPALLPRYSPGVSKPTKTSGCHPVLWFLWFHCISGFTLFSRANRKNALLPSHLHVSLGILGPEAIALRHWISQSEKTASFHSVWGPFLNRTQIYSLGLSWITWTILPSLRIPIDLHKLKIPLKSLCFHQRISIPAIRHLGGDPHSANSVGRPNWGTPFYL